MSTELAARPTDLPVSATMELLSSLVKQNASVEQMMQILQLRREVKADEAREAFFAAMAAFKRSAPRITKNVTKKAGSMDLHYASIDHVVATITPALSAVGIRHRWEMKQDEKLVTVTCVLSHDEGHSESTSLVGPNDTSGSKNPIQAIASTTTYLQRYTLLAATGLAAGGMDDDGGKLNAALSDADFIGHRDAIESANTMDELRDAYRKAYRQAQSIGDKGALDLFMAAYEKGKVRVA